MTDLGNIYHTENFESWQDKKFVYIHLKDRGIDLSFFKEDFDQFVTDVTETMSVLNGVETEESK